MIKAGVAGLGRWGQNLVRSVQGKSENISFTAGTVRHPDKVADFCTEQGLELFDNYDVMLADGDIDAVDCHLIHGAGPGQAVAAAETGVPNLQGDRRPGLPGFGCLPPWPPAWA